MYITKLFVNIQSGSYPKATSPLNENQMKGRYKRLNENVSKWVAPYRATYSRKTSGMSLKDVEINALKIYKVDGRIFLDLNVHNEVICKHPKWKSHIDREEPNEECGDITKRSRTSEEEDYVVHSNQETPNGGSASTQRPIGRDAAKKKVTFADISNGKKVMINRPKKLNCLNHEVIIQMLKMFKVYENDPTIKFVILKGNGKAFCSGGDVTSLIMLTSAGHWSFGANFFLKQYTLDYLLGTYQKPLIALLDGIVMGGGAGLSMNATFRIVTEKTIFAMPEASLGSIPDVGSSYFLPRLPGYFGEYIALTGVRLNGIEMVKCGLGTHFIHSKDLSSVDDALSIMTSSDAKSLKTISEIIEKYEYEKISKLESADPRLRMINECFSKETPEHILASLENLAACRNEKWILDAIKSMRYSSPLCLKLALKVIREGRLGKLDQCLAREHLVVSHLLRRTVNDDFYEVCYFFSILFFSSRVYFIYSYCIYL